MSCDVSAPPMAIPAEIPDKEINVIYSYSVTWEVSVYDTWVQFR